MKMYPLLVPKILVIEQALLVVYFERRRVIDSAAQKFTEIERRRLNGS